MARKKKGAEGSTGDGVLDLRHAGVTRLNISPAGLKARGKMVSELSLRLACDPHRSVGFGSRIV